VKNTVVARILEKNRKYFECCKNNRGRGKNMDLEKTKKNEKFLNVVKIKSECNEKRTEDMVKI